MDQSKLSPRLYLVSTPIGNLQDITLRALETLKTVDAIYCEDTRMTSRLLQCYQIHTRLRTYHEHNADKVRPLLIEAMERGETFALVSDAGTPLISDPGYKLVRAAQTKGIRVSVIPGASAVTAAIALSGLPTDQFKFCGFLPAKSSARQSALEAQKDERGTLIFYESANRLIDCLTDVVQTLGNREISVLREMTKTFEEARRGPCTDILEWYQNHPPRGEVVLCIGGASASIDLSADWKRAIETLAPYVSAKDLCALLTQISPYSKSQVYPYVLECKKNKS